MNTSKSLYLSIILFSLSGCMLNTNPGSTTVTNIKQSLESGDYKSAYTLMPDLKANPSPKAQEQYRSFVTSHREELKIGGKRILRNHFKGNAIRYATIEEFESAMRDDIDEYTSIAGSSAYNEVLAILQEEFDKSRDLYPVTFPDEKIKTGMSMQAFKSLVPKKPVQASNITIPSTPPTDFVVYEHEFSLPKKFNVPGIHPIWIAFHNDKLVRVGYGNSKNAEYEGYAWYLSEDIKAGRKKPHQALSILYQKYKEIFGQPDPLTNEYMTYLIMVAKKVDQGEISQQEAEYKLAQKQSEINEKLVAMQREEQRLQAEMKMHKDRMRAQKRAQKQAETMHQRQMLLQGGLGLLYLNELNQMNSTLRGIQQNNSAPQTYTIRPYGNGTYKVFPW